MYEKAIFSVNSSLQKGERDETQIFKAQCYDVIKKQSKQLRKFKCKKVAKAG